MVRLTLSKSVFGLIIAVFLLVLVPLYAGAYLIYRRGNEAIAEKLTDIQTAQAEYFATTIDAAFQNIAFQQAALIYDNNVRALSAAGSRMTEIERTRAVVAVMTRLDTIRVGSNLLTDISLYIPEVSSVYYASGKTHQLTGGEYAAKYTNARNGVFFTCAGERLVELMPYPLTKDNRFLFCVEAEYSVDAIRDMLLLLNGGGGGDIALIDAVMGEALVSTGGADAALSYYLQLDESRAAEGYTVESGGALVSFQPMRRSGLMLVHSTQLADMEPHFAGQRWTLLAFTAGAALLASLFVTAVYGRLARPMNTLVDALNRVEKGNLDVCINERGRNEYAVLYNAFNSMTRRLHELLAQLVRQQTLAQEARFRQLQAQVNPHFLYNSFFTLNDMVASEDTDMLAEYTSLLGRYFKYITRNDKLDACLEEEYEHARIYAQLQGRRFRNRLRIDFGELPDGLRGKTVPRLILQPVLENALEHGLKDKLADGLLTVRFTQADNAAVITVTDNGEDLSDADAAALAERLANDNGAAENTGLFNIKRRIQFMDSGGDLRAERPEGGGLRVVMTIHNGG